MCRGEFARDIFVRCTGVLVMTPVTLPQAPPVELVQSLFDLTPAEARVARNLAAGETVEDLTLGGTNRVGSDSLIYAADEKKIREIHAHTNGERQSSTAETWRGRAKSRDDKTSNDRTGDRGDLKQRQIPRDGFRIVLLRHNQLEIRT